MERFCATDLLYDRVSIAIHPNRAVLVVKPHPTAEESVHGRIPHYDKIRKELLLPGEPCFWCGQEIASTKDHIHLRSRGGKSRLENFVPACARCNSRRDNNPFLLLDVSTQVRRTTIFTPIPRTETTP